MEGWRVLIVGDDALARTRTTGMLSAAGIGQVSAAPVAEAATAYEIRPELVVVVGDEVPHIVAEVRERPALAGAALLALVPPVPADVASAALAAGADDVVLTPTTAGVLANRCRRMLREGRGRMQMRLAAHCEELLLEIHGIVAERGASPEGLREALATSLRGMGFDRATLVAHIHGSDRGYVIAATDDSSLTERTIPIESYPELLHAMEEKQPLIIEDVSVHSVTAQVAALLAGKRVRALAVFPCVWQGRAVGALFYRNEKAIIPLAAQNVAMARQLAGILAAQLADARVMESLRDKSHRVSRVRYETEQRLRAIDTLKEYFDAAADGVLALDAEGRVLFVNRSAEKITGFAADGLLGMSLADLVESDQREELERVVRRVLSGQNIDPFDLFVPTRAGAPVCVSVATSTVLSSHDAVILSFRDVTDERALEAELRKTTEFLEKLIDSTVDAIVAADSDGTIILFNQGAEAICGYTPEDVIGKLPVWKLYPDDGARQIMRMLRSPQYGGTGRLEQTRRELLAKNGEVVPVNMTASTVYEGAREIATVGIFSDLRERLRIEQRLLQAQEKLMISEKQALVAELAGAAAHELNQPLTSVLAYVELIERTLEAGDRHERALRVIRSEAERMAGIVRKIGRITRYETKVYVGSASILDLDRAAEPGAVASEEGGDAEDSG